MSTHDSFEHVEHTPLHMERCNRHGMEFHILLGCPRCDEELHRIIDAAHAAGHAHFLASLPDEPPTLVVERHAPGSFSRRLKADLLAGGLSALLLMLAIAVAVVAGAIWWNKH